MRRVVLDASVVVKWFREEPGRTEALALRAEFEGGALAVLAPPLLHLELINVAGQRWGWPAAELEELAATLTTLPFELREPDLVGVAAWTSRGLTAYDAAYVALAEEQRVPLLTHDATVLRVAADVARPLGG